MDIWCDTFLISGFRDGVRDQSNQKIRLWSHVRKKISDEFGLNYFKAYAEKQIHECSLNYDAVVIWWTLFDYILFKVNAEHIEVTCKNSSSIGCNMFKMELTNSERLHQVCNSLWKLQNGWIIYQSLCVRPPNVKAFSLYFSFFMYSCIRVSSWWSAWPSE